MLTSRVLTCGSQPWALTKSNMDKITKMNLINEKTNIIYEAERDERKKKHNIKINLYII